MRLFAALPLPEAAVDRLTKLRLRLSSPGDGLRWSTPDQWHITLQFYGDVPVDMVSCLHHRLGDQPLPTAAVSIESLGFFPAKGILFASLASSPTLQQLHANVQARSKDCGFEPETRPFRPHITLARSKGKIGAKTLKRLSVPSLPAFGPDIRWSATECLLLESSLQPEGARYSLYARVPLLAVPSGEVVP